MDIETLDVAGVRFVSCLFLAYGDYDNSTDIERGNVRYIEREYDCVTIYMSHVLRSNVGGISGECVLSDLEYSEYRKGADGYGWYLQAERLAEIQGAEALKAIGGYGSVQMWIREDVDEKNEYLSTLADYPELDDQCTFEVREEMEKEAWESWLKGDLVQAVIKQLESKHADFDAGDWLDSQEVTDNEWFSLFNTAMEATNNYLEIEMGGSAWVRNLDDIADYVSRVCEHVIAGGLWPWNEETQGRLAF